MNTIIETPHLRAVLEEFADFAAREYRAALERHERPTQGLPAGQDKHLADVVTKVTTDEGAYIVSFDMLNYWKYVEEGVQGSANPGSPYKNPGWKAFPFIREWIDIKPVIPRPDDRGKVPSSKSLAYLITRSIVEKGTKGSHDLAEARQKSIEQFRGRIAQALAADVSGYIMKALH